MTRDDVEKESARPSIDGIHPSDDTAFLIEQSPKWLRSFPAAAVHGCRYAASAYSDDLYERFGITRPAFFDEAVVARRADYLSGRYCAAKVLHQLNCATLEVPVGANREPVWPSGTTGSISHTSTRAMAIATRENMLFGLDLEDLIPAILTDGVLETVAVGRELELMRQSGACVRESATALFSMKEAFFKAAFPLVHEFFGFESVVVTMFDQDVGRLHLQLQTTLHDRLRFSQIIDGYFEWSEDKTFLCVIGLGLT